MEFKNWMERVESIGRMSICLVPRKRIKKHEKKIHKFLIKNYGAYSRERSKIEGFWVQGKRVIGDKNEKYEVSFEGKDRIPMLVDFLAKLCKDMKEDAIYLTMGDRSYLVKPD
jgi:hypothetical protein